MTISWRRTLHPSALTRPTKLRMPSSKLLAPLTLHLILPAEFSKKRPKPFFLGIVPKLPVSPMLLWVTLTSKPSIIRRRSIEWCPLLIQSSKPSPTWRLLTRSRHKKRVKKRFQNRAAARACLSLIAPPQIIVKTPVANKSDWVLPGSRIS